MSNKTKGMFALFLALIAVFLFNPRLVNNIHSTILGRLFLISVIIYLSMNNTTLGLIVALLIIVASNQFGSFVEGMENQTIGEENTESTGDKKVLTKSAVNKKLNELKEEGIDKEDIKTTLMPKESNTIPVDKSNNESAEVDPSSSGMLKPSASKLEGFSSFASIY